MKDDLKTILQIMLVGPAILTLAALACLVSYVLLGRIHYLTALAVLIVSVLAAWWWMNRQR